MNNTTTKKSWSTKKKYLVLGGIPLAAVATTAAAAAIIAALAGITGGGQTGNYTAQFKNGTGVAADYSGLAVRASNPTIVGGKLQLPPDLVMFPGESFTMRASLTDEGSSAPGYVSGVVMPGMPAGYTAELTQGCGDNFAMYDQAEVTIKVTAAAEQTPGKSWTLASDAGVQVSLGDKPTTVTCAVYTAP